MNYREDYLRNTPSLRNKFLTVPGVGLKTVTGPRVHLVKPK